MDVSDEATPPDGTPLSVTYALGSPSVVTVIGDADLDGRSLVSDAVEHALNHHPHLIFDLAGVTFADSTFLTVLLQARLTALEHGGSVRLMAPSASVRHLLALTGALSLFAVVTAEQFKHS
ncbi:STAS domain-containing protein [Streptomyces fagopyri]|uniref:STAS domain-containing protein n=1 Tax=Streptomyces fagopyri TaxID=2662397 RepID=UPI0033E90015